MVVIEGRIGPAVVDFRKDGAAGDEGGFCLCKECGEERGVRGDFRLKWLFSRHERRKWQMTLRIIYHFFCWNAIMVQETIKRDEPQIIH